MKHFSDVAAIASMQAKDLAIGPILENDLSIRVVTAVKNIYFCCPNCSHPGYVLMETINGLPCKKCSKASDTIKALIYVCASCCHRETRPRTDGHVHADSAHCGSCNP